MQLFPLQTDTNFTATDGDGRRCGACSADFFFGLPGDLKVFWPWQTVADDCAFKRHNGAAFSAGHRSFV
jgi:hypothetical protein